jgi:hypothetical protein
MRYILLVMLAMAMLGTNAFGQAELAPWGNITGVRKQGQLLPLETALQYVKSDGVQILTTAHERQRPSYKRNGDQQIVTTNLDSLYFEETLIGNGTKARLDIKLTAHSDTTLVGAYFIVKLPKTFDNQTQLKLEGSRTPIDISAMTTAPVKGLAGVMSKGFEYNSANLRIKVKTDQPDSILLRKDESSGNVLVYFTLRADQIKKGETIQKTYELEADGPVDKSPVTLTIDPTKQGRKFDGLGGNFRLQNPTDPQVIDYSLSNLRVAWGRVEMPWRLWQPEKDTNPLDVAQQNQLPQSVTDAMLMAQRLYKAGMPVIVSAWTAPDWAIQGPYHPNPVNNVWGNPLNNDIATDIYRSLARYLMHLKDAYGVEVTYFSFNESDLGINVRMTAQEHANFIKGFGSYMSTKGLKTQLLLGDNSDANSIDFIKGAMADEACKPYIGALAFHSWRGWETATLQKWADAAAKMNLPLLVTEGSSDAAAWQYPAIFQEPSYALHEISLYTRLLSICQPASILQWQLTADYSPLAGGGIFGDASPLRPTQRFFNLKQLASTPRALYALPTISSNNDVTCAALGDSQQNKYTLHLVNNSAERQATVKGIPVGVSKFRVYITNADNGNKESGVKKVENGDLKLKLPARSYVTLISE